MLSSGNDKIDIIIGLDDNICHLIWGYHLMNYTIDLIIWLDNVPFHLELSLA
jgi:hypothetical protein